MSLLNKIIDIKKEKLLSETMAVFLFREVFKRLLCLGAVEVVTLVNKNALNQIEHVIRAHILTFCIKYVSL